MKKLFTTLISCIAVAFLMAPFAFAQTPDGQTPAEETVCDALKGDGVSKGLYGLCVAFCEAQDIADFSDPITEAELETLEAAIPSGRILANYNKRRQDSDPDMPCIQVQEPCPCWSQAELDSIDGLGTDGGLFNCNRAIDDVGFVFAQNISERSPRHFASGNNGSAATPPGFNSCVYHNEQITPTLDRRSLLSSADAASCLAAVKARCGFFGL